MADEDLINIFLTEARDNLQVVEEGLLALETCPTDKELINVVFRAMHSLKGGAGMVGLGQLNLLAHRLENVLDRIRQSDGGMPEEALNLLFSGTDLLKQVLEERDPECEALLPQLDGIYQELDCYDKNFVETKKEDSISLSGFVKVFEENVLEGLADQGKGIFLVTVILSESCLLKSVRAFMVLKAVEDMGEIVKVMPSPEELETENFDTLFSLLVIGEAHTDELQETIENVSEVEKVEIFPVSVPRALELIAEEPGEGGSDTPAQTVTADSGKGPHYFRIELNFNPHTLESGIDPLMFLVELGEYGRILENYVNISRLPEPETLDPKFLYISWTLFYESQLNQEKVEDVFVFIRDENDIKIEDISGDLDLWFSGDKRTGELLVERGLISPDDMDVVLKKQKRIGELLVEEGLVTGGQVEKVVQVQQQFRDREQTDTIRVDTHKLEGILNYVAELLIAQSRVKEMATQGKGKKEHMETELLNAFQEVDKIIRRLQEEVMNASMIPIGSTFVRFQRMVRDLAKELGKDVEVITSGRETELDKKVIEQITDPLKHLIRNCVDHGLETPEEREAAGKSPGGRINLNAFHQEGNIVIEISDDGRGVDEDAVLAKATEKGLVDKDCSLSKSDIHGLLFLPGFSTARNVSDISGRGVGLDVVKTNIQNLRGSVELFSEKGKGTRFSIKLPLTLAIIDGMMVRVGEERFIIPLTSIIEFIKAKTDDICQAEGKGLILQLRREYIPYAGLFELLNLNPEFTNPADGILVILKDGRKKMALLVDEIIGQEQVVIKSMREHMEQVPGIAGATILGNGRVAIILDIISLFRLVGKNTSREKALAN